MASITKGIFIVAAKRTPFGAFGGKLSSKTSIDLAEVASKAALAAGNVNPEIINSVVVGNVISSSSEDGPFISRHLLLRCGIPLDRPALNVNRMCGSGFQAIVTGAHDITMGDSKVVLTAGSESMSGAPFHLRNIRFGTKLGADYKVEDHLWSSGFDSYCKTNMGGTAENLKNTGSVGRKRMNFPSAPNSGGRLVSNEQGFFAKEMAPVLIKGKGGVETSITTDEHPRPKLPWRQWPNYPPFSKRTAPSLPELLRFFNFQGINDGAGAVIIASEAALTEYNLTPLARLVGYGISGVERHIMGIGPVPAIKKLLKISGKSLDQIDLIEINEAFASQTLAYQKELGIDPAKLNVNGGAVAIGHPVGASGSRITAHLAQELK
ncbi:3-ketoacyl-CoA thiolase, mitochondrial [Folsomia candida]|uniref:3-ketoacyl-CoA thiolase, mitochondrial n=1 Tax=Folsomia candida TaxID=158441 RepID=A0A226D9Q4_FOLCA|nr:3-ketoacyl-CoA thiolase, mitochondrial [Folsomia candida]